MTSHKDPNPKSHNGLFFQPHEHRETVGPGHIFRIWQPTNTVMHLSTVLIIADRRRSWSVCKLVQEDSVHGRADYREYCAPVHQQKQDAHLPHYNNDDHENCKPLYLYLNKTQQLHSRCWIDLVRSYDVGNEDKYEFVKCGRMLPKSFDYARRKHFELYTSP